MPCLKPNAHLAGALSSLFFVVLNVAMNIYMKWLFAEDGGDFALPWTMLAVQQLEAYLILQPCIWRQDPAGCGGWNCSPTDARAGNDQVCRTESVQKPMELVHFLQVLAVTLLFCLNVGLNSLSLVEISITLNQTVRAFLPVGVLLLSSVVEQRAYPAHSYVTTVVLVLGIALTCWGSPDFRLHGFSLALLSTLVAAAGTSLNGRLLSKGPFSKGGPYGIARLMMIQSVPAFFIFGFIAWLCERDSFLAKLSGESTSRWHWYHHFLLVSVSSLLALLSNLGRCFLVAATSALMETFAGNAKVAALCAIDHSLFGTALFPYNYVGIVLTFLGFSIHVLLQYAWKEKDEPQAAGKPEVAGDMTQGESESLRSMPTVKRLVRPRLVSAADTGLVCEHFALEMGRETQKRSSGDTSNATGETRQRAMTWQQGVHPFLQPEYTSGWGVNLENLEWNQILEVPTFSWLDGDRPRVSSAASEEYSPLHSPGRQNGCGSPNSGRSRFWSEQMHSRLPKSRRREAGVQQQGPPPEITFLTHSLPAVVEEDMEESLDLGGFGSPREKLPGRLAALDEEDTVEAQRNLPPLDVGYL